MKIALTIFQVKKRFEIKAKYMFRQKLCRYIYMYMCIYTWKKVNFHIYIYIYRPDHGQSRFGQGWET